MFFLLTKRVVRYSRDPDGDRYAARHQNYTSWTVSGPFAKRAAADRAAVGALATHTCLAAQVLSGEQLELLAKASSSEEPDYDLVRTAQRARKWLATA